MSDHDDIASMNMVFSLSYSFEATHVQLSYLDNDCENSTNEKVRNYSNRPIITCDWLGTRCAPIKLTIAMRRYIKPFYITNCLNNMPIHRELVNYSVHST